MPWTDKRPMSPHLQVYNLPFTAKLSILHRLTGAVLLGALFLMVLVLLSLSLGPDYWQILSPLLSSYIGYIILFSLTFSLYFHLCNGLRHLFWDKGLYLEKSSLNKTGILVLISSISLTALTWSIRFLL